MSDLRILQVATSSLGHAYDNLAQRDATCERSLRRRGTRRCATTTPRARPPDTVCAHANVTRSRSAASAWARRGCAAAGGERRKHGRREWCAAQPSRQELPLTAHLVGEQETDGQRTTPVGEWQGGSGSVAPVAANHREEAVVPVVEEYARGNAAAALRVAPEQREVDSHKPRHTRRGPAVHEQRTSQHVSQHEAVHVAQEGVASPRRRRRLAA
mmetsp:Transcript_12697/g.31764  ORF Transcript_12697/g.31764 Transcript_12697/m.31764 type:complete len:214 (+) Transcript_12697:19-660(+)